MEINSTEQAHTPAQPVGGGLIEVIQCLIEWLESQPNDDKPHKILSALALESYKKAKQFSQEEKRRFTADEILAAAGIEQDEPNRWLEWNRVMKYWDARESQIIDHAKKKGLASYPKPDKVGTSGGQGKKASYFIKEQTLPSISEDIKLAEPMRDGVTDRTKLTYELAEHGEVKPVWYVRWIFRKGEIRLTRWHIWFVIMWMTLIGGGVLLLSYISLIAFSAPKPITTRELITLIYIFVIPYITWMFSIKPWVNLFNDRIVTASEHIVAFKEKPAQIELFRDGDLRLLRLVRYSAPCPICGATIFVEDGSPDFPRRMVGRCSESPREHIYSFDRVTRKGNALRIP
jgi:hypothetical protein